MRQSHSEGGLFTSACSLTSANITQPGRWESCLSLLVPPGASQATQVASRAADISSWPETFPWGIGISPPQTISYFQPPTSSYVISSDSKSSKKGTNQTKWHIAGNRRKYLISNDNGLSLIHYKRHAVSPCAVLRGQGRKSPCRCGVYPPGWGERQAQGSKPYMVGMGWAERLGGMNRLLRQ